MRDRNQRGDPYQRRERRLEVHLVSVLESRASDGCVDEVCDRAGDQHGDAHHEDPYEQLYLHDRVGHAEQNERDQRHAGDAVGFETIGAWADRIARVIAGAVRDHAGVARVVLFDLEHDLHQIGADIGDFREDAACDAQRRRAQRFADGETDEAWPSVVARNEEQDDEHHHQFNADQHHSDAHTRAQRNLINRIGLTAKARKRRPRVRKCVHANPEPCNAVTSQNSHDAEEQNHRYFRRFVVTQHAEIQHDDGSDENPKQKEKLALIDEVGLAGFVDQLRNFAHRAMHGQILKPHVNRHAECEAKKAEKNSPDQQ